MYLGVDYYNSILDRADKMAAVMVIGAVLWILRILSKTEAVTVELTLPVHPVTVGGVLGIQCEIQNMEEGYEASLLRNTNGLTERLTSGITYVPSSLGQRVFVTERSMPGGIRVYFMTIVDTSLLDSGKYSCKVINLEELDKFAEDSIDVEIFQLPDSIYPQCQSTPAEITNIRENVDLRFTCISSKGVPSADLRWKTTANLDIASRNQERDNTVSSEFYVRISKHHDGALFICEMTSSGFPDFMRTYQIGPITVQKGSQPSNKPTSALLPAPVLPTKGTKQETDISCNTKCPSGDNFTILYLSVATIGAGMLCLLFLTTTIIWCSKYNKITAQARRSSEINVSPGDGSEPVYVSLQRRPDEERNTTFMTVEDPNNPGNKVLMPKEVMDEFYRSLSLKKV